MSIFDLRVDPCGCCEPPAPGTPEPVANRPALDEVVYRVGSYPTFREAMIRLVPLLGAQLARREGLPAVPLAGWTSRSRDDYGIALIEMWAVVSDVLTFYQERYANEAWLRTAEERQAIRRLAGLLGYRLRPGAAARTHLAVVLDDGVDLEVPAGLRTQSVPREGERPQKYETDAALSATSGLNRVPVFGEPLAVAPLAVDRSHVTLRPGSPVPPAGAAVALFTPGGGIEQRSVARAATDAGRAVLRWSRPLGDSHQRAFVRGRSFRTFGHSAPGTWVRATPAPSGSFLEWSTEPTTFSFTSADVYLEGTVEGIEPGSRVLVDDDGVARLRTVEEVASTTRTVGPQTGAATRVRLSSAVAHDVRTTIVHELGDELQAQDWELPGELPAGTTAVFVPYPEVAAVGKGRLVILDDDRREPLLAVVEADATPHPPGSTTEFLRVPLAAPTGRSLDAGSAFAFGNVVAVSHGETVADEVLGDGDAAATLQGFALAKGPVTHTHDARAPGGVRSSLDVDVDRVRWRERPGLYGAGPDERVYATEIDDEQRMTVRFGDGRAGAVVPTGRGNVVATYRHGIGTEGNVDAGRIAVPLDRPTGLDEVTNPLPAHGGVDPETTAAARRNAPNTVRTFDRAISVRDFSDLAREFAGVGKAHASWVWDGQERVVHLTVGGVGGAPLGTALGDLRTYLDLRRDPNRAVRIGEYRPVPFLLSVAVEARPDRFAGDVAHVVRAAVTDHLAYDARDFGQAVHLSDVYAVVQSADGVASALVTRLVYKRAVDVAAHGAGAGPVLVHAPIFGARHVTAAMQPAELATLEAADDLELAVSGGLRS